MVKNNKGTILVVAVVAMSIMIIIGFICLRIYSNQSILDTKDVVKQRLYYSAVGSVEAMKGFLVEKVAENIQSRVGQPTILQGDITAGGVNEGFLARVTNNSTRSYAPFQWGETTALFDSNNAFDSTMHPVIKSTVKLIRLKNNERPSGTLYFKGDIVTFPTIGNEVTSENKGYVIEAKTEATFKTALNSVNSMTTTVRYYFYTRRTGDGTVANPILNTIYSVGWRID